MTKKKAIEDWRVLAIKKMGRETKGPVEQSQKKPKTFKYPRERGEGDKWRRFGMPNDDKILLLPDAFLDEMKRMNPQEVANILLSKEM